MGLLTGRLEGLELEPFVVVNDAIRKRLSIK
jgi:hypothetical protein